MAHRHGIEVWYSNGTGDECSEHGWPIGWYWWACFPGCLPDSDPHGPFIDEGEAWEDANIGGLGDDGCEG